MNMFIISANFKKTIIFFFLLQTLLINGCSQISSISSVTDMILTGVDKVQFWKSDSVPALKNVEEIQYSTLVISNPPLEGSGISLGNGYILTCYHILDINNVPISLFQTVPPLNRADSDLVKIHFYEQTNNNKDKKGKVTILSGKSNLAIVVAVDKVRDLALLRCDSFDDLNKRKIKVNYKNFPNVGEKVYYAGGHQVGVVTNGMLSSTIYKDGFVSLLVTCSIVPGCSGGAILNEDMELIGLMQNAHKDNSSWSTGIRSDEIYEFLKNNKLEHILE